jgi:hypothetical protein
VMRRPGRRVAGISPTREGAHCLRIAQTRPADPADGGHQLTLILDP